MAISLVERIPAVCWEADPVTLRVLAVEGAVDDLGFPSREWLEDPRFVRARLFALETAQLDDAIDRALRAGKSECVHRILRGSNVDWMRTLFRSGGPSLVALTVDATGRKKLEAELRDTIGAVRQREDLLSIASHELRGPIAALRLTEQAIRRLHETGRAGSVAPDLGQLIGLLRPPTEQIAELVEVLFDVAQIQAGTFRIQLEPVDLVPIARRAVERARAYRTPPPPILLRSPPSVVGRWHGARLGQVLGNLLSNAVKYGLGRPIEVTIELRGPDAVEIAVHDDGIGIAADQRTRIFQRFGRAAGDVYPGLGLGLYIVQQIVHNFGGGIDVDSARERGTTFRVVLPLHAASTAQATSSEEAHAEPM